MGAGSTSGGEGGLATFVGVASPRLAEVGAEVRSAAVAGTYLEEVMRTARVHRSCLVVCNEDWSWGRRNIQQ